MTADPLRSALELALGAQYDVIRLVGRGGAGAVYLAKERLLERPVAIKVLHHDASDEDSRQRFLREARTAARLSHPNIVPLLSFGEADDMLFYIMPFVDGESLESRLKRDQRLAAADARRILGEIAAALEHAHAQGIVHRDVKPDNVLLERESGRAMLTDFGIARRTSEGQTLTRTGMVVGTPHYMAPEQAITQGEIDGRTDLYALGVIGYRMVTGRLPFEGRSIEEILARHATAQPVPLTQAAADVPIDLAVAITRCLEKEPAARWPGAEVFRHAITGGAPHSEPVPDRLEGLPRLGTRGIGITYGVSLLTGAFYAWDHDPAWWAVAGLTAAVFAGMIAFGVVRARRLGLAPAIAVRLAFRPPEGWWGWWPAALRAPGDLWDRLPDPVRRARATFGATLVALFGVMIPAELGMIIARHHPPVPRLFAWAGAAALASMPVLAIAGGLVLYRFARGLGMGAYERAKLLQEPTTGSAFWTRPGIARLLAGPPGDPASGAWVPRGPGEIARSIAAMENELPTDARILAREASRAATDIAALVRDIDREIAELAGHREPGELQRVRDRLASLGAPVADESPAMRQVRELLTSQLALIEQLGEREVVLRERRTHLEDHLRTLWLQLLRLRQQEALSAREAEEITGEIRALCNSIERRVDAVAETRALVQ